jgi:hypothetical protein
VHAYVYYYLTPYAAAHPGLLFLSRPPPPPQPGQAPPPLPPVTVSLTPVGTAPDGGPSADRAVALVPVPRVTAASSARAAEADAFAAVQHYIAAMAAAAEDAGGPALPVPAAPEQLPPPFRRALRALARARVGAARRAASAHWGGRLPVPDDVKVRPPVPLPARALVFARFPVHRLRHLVKVPLLPPPPELFAARDAPAAVDQAEDK